MRTLQHNFEAGNCSLIDAVKDIRRYRISLKEPNSVTGKQAIYSGEMRKSRDKSQGKTMSQEMALGTQMPKNGINPEFREA